MYRIALLLGDGPGFWDYVTSLFSTIPKIMYLLWVAAMSVLDVMQMFMRKLAGLDVYYNAAGTPAGGDIVLNFLYGVLGIGGVDYPALNAAFWSLIALSIVLLVLFTTIAIIKAQYLPSEAKKAAPLQYVGKAFQAVAEFAIVPLTCIIAMWLCNIILIGLDSATQFQLPASMGIDYDMLEPYSYQGPLDKNKGQVYRGYDFFGLNGESMGAGSMTFSGQVFMTAAYKANRVRLYDEGSGTVGYDPGGGMSADGTAHKWDDRNGFFTKNSGGNANTVASIIDFSFANHFKLKDENASRLTIGGTRAQKYCLSSGVDIFSARYAFKFKSFSKYNVAAVWYYYDLWQFDFLVGFAALVVMLSLFTNIIFGLAKRIFEMTGLFIIVPPIIAMRPLDDGAALKTWRGEFQKRALMAYGSIIGMNVMMLILPYVNEVKFFNPNEFGMSIVNNLISSIMIIVGLVSVKSFIDICSTLVGGANAEKEGGDVAKATGSALAKAGALTAGAASVGIKGMGALSGAGAINKVGGGITGAIRKKVGGATGKDVAGKEGALATAKASKSSMFGGNKIDEGISDKYQEARQKAIDSGASPSQVNQMSADAVKDDLAAAGHIDMNDMYGKHSTNSGAVNAAYTGIGTAQSDFNTVSAKNKQLSGRNLLSHGGEGAGKGILKAGKWAGGKIGGLGGGRVGSVFGAIGGGIATGARGFARGSVAVGNYLSPVFGATKDFGKQVQKEWGGNAFWGDDGFKGKATIGKVMGILGMPDPAKASEDNDKQKEADAEARRRMQAEIRAGIRNPDGSLK